MKDKDQETCPNCNYCKFVNEYCTKCFSYFNETMTPTDECKICHGRKPLNSQKCYHSHWQFRDINVTINPQDLITTTHPITIPNGEVLTIKPYLTVTGFKFFAPGSDDKEVILEIKEDGFWVRGVKVEQNKDEAKNVYNAFKKLLGFKE